jgi:hypothetical protein
LLVGLLALMLNLPTFLKSRLYRGKNLGISLELQGVRVFTLISESGKTYCSDTAALRLDPVLF